MDDLLPEFLAKTNEALAELDLERFSTLLDRMSRAENTPSCCFGEHLYATDDPVWSYQGLVCAGAKLGYQPRGRLQPAA